MLRIQSLADSERPRVETYFFHLLAVNLGKLCDYSLLMQHSTTGHQVSVWLTVTATDSRQDPWFSWRPQPTGGRNLSKAIWWRSQLGRGRQLRGSGEKRPPGQKGQSFKYLLLECSQQRKEQDKGFQSGTHLAHGKPSVLGAQCEEVWEMRWQENGVATWGGPLKAIMKYLSQWLGYTLNKHWLEF